MIGTTLSLSLPLPSDPMATVVAKTATCLGQLRDSMADKAAQAGLNLNSDISFLGNRATNVGGVMMVDGNNPTAAGSIYYHSGEFYAIDGTGTIKLTNLGALNAAGIGGIGGDYGGVNPALVSYDNATGQYRFYTNGGTHTWADLAAASLILEGTAGTTKLTCDTSVTVNQTLPIGRINSTDLLVWDGAKIIPAGASNTYGTGLKLGGNLTVAGQYHFTNSLQYVVPLAVGVATDPPLHNCAVGYLNVTASGVNWTWSSNPLRIAGGDTVVQFSVTFTTAGTGTKTIELHSVTNTSGTDTTLATASSTSTTVPLTITSSVVNVATDTAHQYFLKVLGPATGDVFTMVTFSSARP